MKTTIAKDFIWNMSHRLTFHDGLCKHIHGHTYKMTVILEGETDKYGMVMDYYDVEKIVKPEVDKLDHAFICSKDDDLMINFLNENNFRYVVMDDFTTAENLCTYFMNKYKNEFKKFSNIDTLTIKVFETFDVFAEQTLKIS